jgi:predicted nucleic acid-binding Zn ribbon protein
MDELNADQQEEWDLAQIRQRPSRFRAKPIGSMIRRLMSSSGYGETQAAEQLREQWSEAVGSTLANLSRPGNVSRSVLHVHVANSAVMQEIHFRKKQILVKLQSASVKISELRIRVGPID